VKKTRIALKQVQEGEYIFLSEQNYIKEAKLKAILRSYKIYNKQQFNKALNKVYEWLINN
jgi:hypothetical protein